MNETLENGLYLANTYDHYYNLSLPSSGNVFIEIAHQTGYSAIYDEDLNFVADIGNGPIFLEAGSYIVHADYSSPTNGALNFYAPQLAAPEELTSLATGLYSASTYDHYYNLSLPSSGNVFIEIAHQTGYSAIYDEDLNFVADIGNGPIFLEAGSYIVHADYTSRTNGALSFYLSTVEGGPTSGDDVLTGTSGRDSINGLAGDDKISGRGGRDYLRGGTGDDKLFGGAGNDLLKGGAGNDILHGNAGSDRLEGGTGGDTLFGELGQDKLFGGAGNDTLKGGDSRDVLHGNAGRDRLEGGAQGDRLFGDSGNDKLFGNAGGDILNGGKGADQLIGGRGADTFVFKDGYGKDTIRDFTNNVDTIQLDDALWTGTLTKQQVINRFAEEVNGDIVFDFGTDELTIQGFTNLSALKDDMDII